MKKIIFVTGVNGVGKTTAIRSLKSQLDSGFEVHDFDEQGVPVKATRQWRLEKTKYWIGLGTKNAEKGIITIVCGFVRPSEINDNDTVGFILLDANDDTIRERLSNRHQTPESIQRIESVTGKKLEKFIADNANFATVMRQEVAGFGETIVDTNNKTPDVVGKEVIDAVEKLAQS